jgi:hypothetical protein
MNNPSRPPFVLCGTVGFGLGGVLCGLLQPFVLPYLSWSPLLQSLAVSAGFGIMGMLGGALLSLPLRDPRIRRRLIVAGFVGFGLGGLVNLILVWPAGADPSTMVPVLDAERLPPIAGIYAFLVLLWIVPFAARGAIGGALLGLAIPGRHAVRVLALFGAFGFGVGSAVGLALLQIPGGRTLSSEPSLAGMLGTYAVWMGSIAAVGGAFLGLGVRMLTRPQPS